MKLRQIVCDKTVLTLVKEKKIIKHGEVFTIDDEKRANQILEATYHNKPVAEIVVGTVKKNTKKSNKTSSK